MDEVSVVFVAVGRCVDACLLLFDLVVGTFGWLQRFLSAVAVSLHETLVDLSGSTLIEYWNLALFSFLAATEAVSSAVHGALHAAEAWLLELGGVFESFKMVGHLFCHVTWRAKDVLHRGFISASGVLRQTCECVVIALSLVLYFVNTVVNVVLIGTQNCLSALVGVWETVAAPVHTLAELALTLLTFLYSSLVGASVLLWTPCRLLLDFLRDFDSHILVVTATGISLALLVLNPALPVRLVGALPGARGVKAVLRRMYGVIVEPALVQARTTRDVNGSRLSNRDADGVRVNDANTPPPASVLRRTDSPQEDEASSTNSTADDGELLSLLKEQEDRKKCVICQDLSKTVLLLPCRHLCLCRHCANILTLRRPAQQRCCPLCRRHITEMMDVFL